MIVMDNPYDGSIQSGSPGYVLTQSFHWFLHFSRFVRDGMERVGTKDKSSSLRNVLVLAFVSKTDGSSTVILVNKSQKWLHVECGYLPHPVTEHPREVYYSTLNESFTYAGRMNPNTKVFLKPQSITTLYSGRF